MINRTKQYAQNHSIRKTKNILKSHNNTCANLLFLTWSIAQSSLNEPLMDGCHQRNTVEFVRAFSGRCSATYFGELLPLLKSNCSTDVHEMPLFVLYCRYTGKVEGSGGVSLQPSRMKNCTILKQDQLDSVKVSFPSTFLNEYL